MDYKKLISSLLVLLAVAQFHAVAEPVSVGAAQAMANGFIKSHFKSMPGSLKAPAMSDIVLAYAEPSDKVAQANVYYIFNTGDAWSSPETMMKPPPLMLKI